MILAPDFKQLISWTSLNMLDIEPGDRVLGQKQVKNFVTLVAIKVQGLMNELTESRLLLKTLVEERQNLQSEQTASVCEEVPSQ